jgi:hypothetical protein
MKMAIRWILGLLRGPNMGDGSGRNARVTAWIVVGAMLTFFTAWSPVSQAKDINLSVQYAGVGMDSGIDFNSDGYNAGLVDADAKGAFGAKTVSILYEFTTFGEQSGCTEGFLLFPIVHSTAVTTFSDLDQLLALVTQGEMCLNPTSGAFYGEARGIFLGGTGRFVGAAGNFVSPFTGQNLPTPPEIGFLAISGSLEGVVTLSD